MVILAIAILLLYIQPTVANIRAVQDEIAIYQSELDRVTDVNTLLGQHVEKINLLPLSDIQALERYLPTTIDEIAVMRDLQLLTTEVGVTLLELSYKGVDGGSASEGDVSLADAPVVSAFELGVEGSYQDIKRLLGAIEVNNYQLTVDSVDMSPEEDGNVNARLTLFAYSLEKPVTEEVSGDNQIVE